jgi:glycyl-tRNA synthetase beta chain
MPDFLLEIGLEEVPARMLAGAQKELERFVVELLINERLLEDAIREGFTRYASVASKSYSTPRRLAVFIPGVKERQDDFEEHITGPAVKIAFKDGVPTPAAEAFARKSGIAVADLRTITTPKGDYLAATTLKRGRTAAEVLAAELPKEIAALYWAKNMRWIPGSNEKFVRPVLWLVSLLGEEVVPVTFAGRTAGRATYGHRVLSSGEPFEIVAPDSYLAQLEGEYVLADVELRRQKIRKALDKVTREIPNARWREDEALVDSVTHLTEWPDVLLGNFEPAYLTLPEEVLVTVMRDHQKYFAVEDAHGKLAPHFLTVTNIALTAENTPIIRQGNERVLRARFNDARFFWEFDQRTPLEDRVKLLENVTFQKDLGSYAQKSERIAAIAHSLATFAIARGCALDEKAIAEAALLAKADLTTELVKEFTELQGQIGGLYAASQGLSLTVADAIYDQYLPASAKDAIPRSPEGCILGLADRIDTIAEMFRLGMEPTGSKDPFALRRAANAIVRILAEGPVKLFLSDVLHAAASPDEVEAKLQPFFSERVEFYLRDIRGHAYDVVKAVLAVHANDLSDAVARADAVTSVRGGEDFIALSAAFKRMKNILDQATEHGSRGIGILVDPTVVTASMHPSQKALIVASKKIEEKFAALARDGNYVAALQALATIRPEVDSFFENVKVIDDVLSVRTARLGLLHELVVNFNAIADFSEIVTAG